MATIKSLKDTNILQNFKAEYSANIGAIVEEDQVFDMYQAIFEAVADFMREVKKKNAKTALVFSDTANNFILAAVVEYNKNANEDGQDNWNYYFTFDENDIKDATNKHDINETAFHIKLSKRLLDHTLRCTEATFISPMLSLAASCLSTFLEQNAKPGEETTLEEEGYFLASVTVEDDEIVKALLPDGAMKSLIKDDAATEKAA